MDGDFLTGLLTGRIVTALLVRRGFDMKRPLTFVPGGIASFSPGVAPFASAVPALARRLL